MRDYEGWPKDDFEKYKKWMLEVWYPFCVRFLRKRNGTWKNENKWWEAPGHYWSNWGLCNALAVMSIGILCDDVYLYNQGISFIKYDQVGTFVEPRTDNPIKNDGLTEFLGNLVVTTSLSDLEKNAYGKLGQMNESGRDMGHATMAVGLIIEIALQAWKQGDDLFSYMDYRLAAGIEFTAAQILNITNLPWTTYHYGTNGFYYTDNRSEKHTSPAYEYPSPIRPYWGIVIGIYEEIKGVSLPLSHTTYELMGIDEGPKGSTSGGYDHIGYSVLLNTRDGLNPANKVPTELKGKIKYEDNDFNLEYLIPSIGVEKNLGNINLEEKTISHSELGGLINNYTTLNDVGIPKGSKLTLIPVLPEGEEDTGNWLWNTGETTKDINIILDKSFAYRVRYKNQNGIDSYQLFTLAVQGDCLPSKGIQYIYNNSTKESHEGLNIVEVNKGDSITLELKVDDEFGTIQWSEGESNSYSLYIENVNENKNVEAIFKNLCGRDNIFIFQIKIKQEQNQEIKTYYKIQKKSEINEWKDTSDYLININELLIKPLIEKEKTIYFGVKCGYNIPQSIDYIRLYPTDLNNFEICEIIINFNNDKNNFNLDLSTNHIIPNSYAKFILSHTLFNTELFEINFDLFDKNGNKLDKSNYLEIEKFLVDKFTSEKDFTPIHKKIISKIENNMNLVIKLSSDNMCFIPEKEQYEIEIIIPDKKCSEFKTNLECNDYLISDLVQCLWIENVCNEIIIEENCQILNGLCSFKSIPIEDKLCSLNEEKTECILTNIQENNNNEKDEKDKADGYKNNKSSKLFINYRLFILFFLILFE